MDKNMLWINRTPVSHVTSTTTFVRITSMSMIPNIAKNLHGYNGYNGTDLVKQKFEQKNASFPEFMMKVVDVTVSTQMSQVVDEPRTPKNFCKFHQ